MYYIQRFCKTSTGESVLTKLSQNKLSIVKIGNSCLLMCAIFNMKENATLQFRTRHELSQERHIPMLSNYKYDFNNYCTKNFHFMLYVISLNLGLRVVPRRICCCGMQFEKLFWPSG